MRKLTLSALASVALLGAQFTPDESTRLSYSVPAFNRSGERKVQKRDVYLDTFGKKGQPIKRRLAVVFDPLTGYFLYSYLGLGNIEESIEGNRRLIESEVDRTTVRSAAYISERGILLVTPGKPNIGIMQSNEKAASLDDAEQRAIRKLAANALDAARFAGWPSTRQVALLDREGKNALLPTDFYVPPLSPVAGPVTVVGIAESAEGWEITLKGQYTARVKLSLDFQPLGAERVDPSKQ